MNLFELKYCPFCNSKLNDDGQCNRSWLTNYKIKIFGTYFIDHFYYNKTGFLLFKENLAVIDLNLDKTFSIYFNYNEPELYKDVLDIDLTLNNLEEIINLLNNRAKIVANNFLFL